MLTKQSLLFVLLATSNLISGAQNPELEFVRYAGTPKKPTNGTSNTIDQIITLREAAKDVEQASRKLTPPTRLQQMRRTVKEKTVLFLARHPNRLSDALLTRILMTETVRLAKGQQYIVEKYPETAPALQRLMARQLIKSVANAHKDVRIGHNDELLIALELATPEEAQLITPAAVRNFTQFMEGNPTGHGHPEAKILAHLMQKDPQAAQQFGAVMLAHPNALEHNIGCTDFGEIFFTQFAKSSPESLVELAKAIQAKNNWDTWELNHLKRYMTPEQISAAGFEPAAPTATKRAG